MVTQATNPAFVRENFPDFCALHGYTVIFKLGLRVSLFLEKLCSNVYWFYAPSLRPLHLLMLSQLTPIEFLDPRPSRH